MRYSTYNAIPHNPKSKKHPYETLEKSTFSGFVILSLCHFTQNDKMVLALFTCKEGQQWQFWYFGTLRKKQSTKTSTKVPNLFLCLQTL